MCEAEEKIWLARILEAVVDILLEICQRGSCVFPNKSAFKDFGLCTVYIRGFFLVSQICEKWENV